MTKPIAWIHYFKNGGYQITPNKKYPKDQPLYLEAPKKWVGLTDSERLHFVKMSPKWSILELLEFAEEELRIKNGN